MPSASIVHQPAAAPPVPNEQDPPVRRPGRRDRDPVGGQATDVGPVGPDRVDVLLLPVDRLEQDRAPSGDHLGYCGGEGRRAQLAQPLPSASTSQIASSLGGMGPPPSFSPYRKKTICVPSGDQPGAARPVGTGRAQLDDPTAREVHRGDRREVPRMPDASVGLPDEGEARAVAGEGDLRVAQAGSGAAGVHGLGAAAARIGQVELSFVRVEEASPVGRPDRTRLVGDPIGDDLVGALPVRSDDAESGARAWHVAGETGARPCRRAG